MKWQSSAMARGVREKLVKLNPKVSRLVCQNPAREVEKLIKKKPQTPTESHMSLLDNINTQLRC